MVGGSWSHGWKFPRGAFSRGTGFVFSSQVSRWLDAARASPVNSFSWPTVAHGSPTCPLRPTPVVPKKDHKYLCAISDSFCESL